MEWNGIWHGIWNRFSSHNAATDGHTTYYSISSETTEGIDTRNSSLCAFIVQQSHSIHLPTHLRLNFSKETDVTELRTCASVSSLTAVLVPDIVKFIVLSSGVMTGFHLGNWAVVLKCLGFLYTVATVNSHLPVVLDNQPANLCNTHQGLWVSVQHSISECKHWLCYSLVECSGCHGNQFFPSLHNHLSIPVCTSIQLSDGY